MDKGQNYFYEQVPQITKFSLTECMNMSENVLESE